MLRSPCGHVALVHIAALVPVGSYPEVGKIYIYFTQVSGCTTRNVLREHVLTDLLACTGVRADDHAEVKINVSYTTSCSEFGYHATNNAKIYLLKATGTGDATCVRCSTGAHFAAVKSNFVAFEKAGMYLTGPGEVVLMESRVIGASQKKGARMYALHGVHASGLGQEFKVRALSVGEMLVYASQNN